MSRIRRGRIMLERLVDLSRKLPVGHAVVIPSTKGTWSLTCPVSLTSDTCAKEKVEDNLTLETYINVGDLPYSILHNMAWEMECYIGDNRLGQLRREMTGVVING